MSTVRPPAVAGLFYPLDAVELRETVARELARSSLSLPQAPKALIVPHAGFQYSACVAAVAYHALQPYASGIRRVILLGPSHRYALADTALPQADAMQTPLGSVQLDSEACKALQALGVMRNEQAHAFEHALEVQLPFLQAILPGFRLVPLLIGDCTPERVATLLDAVWGGPETLILVSSDLSHYESQACAREHDLATLRHIVAGNFTLDHRHACGATPLMGLQLCAQRRGLTARLLDYRNSGDTAGPHDRVVGYAAVAFCEEEEHARTH
ncbi:AmmeMemoRadiSam system protein B [Chitinilyticum litopenaei]|uniref:AmmeMemoRadiSam system protein B n=1 Tax=Chitinilyticum litopenaei TaxID=1121276 RepID=UPI00048EC49E|nr:AmmeMemoRadiSam system protein B [Chitinilyticum litopenaei]